MPLSCTSDSYRVKHQELYKAKTPPWRQAFRDKCFQRLKNSRSNLVDRFRNTGGRMDEQDIKNLVEEEWKSLCDESSDVPNLFKRNEISENKDDTEINAVLTIMEDIQKDLLIEEQRLLESYLATEEAMLESTVSWLERDEVICPLCQKHSLFQNRSSIFCMCGMRIDTQEDNLTLVHLKMQLHEGLYSHEQNCDAPPAFSLMSLTDARITNLIINCEICSFMFIVI